MWKPCKCFSELSREKENAENIHEAAMCKAMAEEYSPDNGAGDRGSERTEIKMPPETCHNGPGQMVVVNTGFGECLHNYEQNFAYHVKRILCTLKCLLPWLHFSFLFSEDLLHSQRFRQMMDRHSSWPSCDCCDSYSWCYRESMQGTTYWARRNSLQWLCIFHQSGKSSKNLLN